MMMMRWFRYSWIEIRYFVPFLVAPYICLEDENNSRRTQQRWLVVPTSTPAPWPPKARSGRTCSKNSLFHIMLAPIGPRNDDA